MEYVGEVINVDTCMKVRSFVHSFRPSIRLVAFAHSPVVSRPPQRLEEATKAEKNFYMLTLNGSECVDASLKGNFGRFINHSCNPNAATQKWWVRGELRVGIFALRDIKKGEEITFDYQFERIGNKKQPYDRSSASKHTNVQRLIYRMCRCYCGEKECRGFLEAKKRPDKKMSNESLNKKRSPMMPRKKKVPNRCVH